MIEHLKRYAEAVPCIAVSSEKTCYHLIKNWMAGHGCPITFESNNGSAFVGDLTKELMRPSQKARTHSTTNHPQTKGLVERRNRGLWFRC